MPNKSNPSHGTPTCTNIDYANWRIKWFKMGLTSKMIRLHPWKLSLYERILVISDIPSYYPFFLKLIKLSIEENLDIIN